jgi:hypothetical protein
MNKLNTQTPQVVKNILDKERGETLKKTLSLK